MTKVLQILILFEFFRLYSHTYNLFSGREARMDLMSYNTLGPTPVHLPVFAEFCQYACEILNEKHYGCLPDTYLQVNNKLLDCINFAFNLKPLQASVLIQLANLNYMAGPKN